MDWDQYYEKFYDWATSTQISRMSSLTSYGASSEVAEVAQEYMDEKAASRLIKKAVAYGVQFTPEEIYDLSGCCNTEAMNVLLDSSKCRFTKEQLEDLYGAVDDEVLERVAARNKISLFEDDEDEEMMMRLSRKSSSMSRLLLPLKSASLQSFSQELELLMHSHPLTLLIRDIVPAIVRTVLPIMAIAMGDGIMVMVMCMAVSSAGTKATEACNGVIHVGL